MRHRVVKLAILACACGMGALAAHGMGRQTTDLDRAVALAATLRERAVDLTYTFDDKTIYWPTDDPFEHKRTRWGRGDGGWYASATYKASEHGGTHLDSPVHFAEGQPTTEEISIGRLIAPAVVVDVTEACAADRDYQLRVADLKAWEAKYGEVPNGAIVLVRTGFGKFWPDRKRYLGTDVPGDVTGLHFPGVGPEAAEWLAKGRKVSGVGIDTPSLDHGPSGDFRAHRALNGAGIFGLENVANLERLPEAGAVLMAMPMKIGGGSGGPTRVVAILPSAPGR